MPAPGAKINVTDDAMDVDAAHLGFTTSPHEECGVEGAIQLKEQHGGEVTVLTLGPGEAEEQLRYAASVGADHGVLIPTNGTAWDPQRTATAITEAIGVLEEDLGRDEVLYVHQLLQEYFAGRPAAGEKPRARASACGMAGRQRIAEP